MCSCAASPSPPPLALRPIERPRATPPAPCPVEVSAVEPSKPRDRRELAVLLHHAYRERSLGHSQAADLLFKLFVELAPQGEKPKLGVGAAKGRVVRARGGVAAFDSPDGPVFFRADTGEPFAFEPDVSLRSQDPSHDEPRGRGAPLFWVDVGSDQATDLIDRREPRSDDPHVAFFDPTARKFFFGGPEHIHAPGGHLVYAYLSRDCRWHAWDIEKQQEAYALESHIAPAKCNRDLDLRYRTQAAVLTADERWLIAQGGLWDLKSRRLIIRDSDPPSLSPDEQYVAYLTGVDFPQGPEGFRHRRTLVLLELATGKKTKTSGPLLADSKQPFLSGDDFMNPFPVTFDKSTRSVMVVPYTSAAVFAVPSLQLISLSIFNADAMTAARAGQPPLPPWPASPPQPPAGPTLPVDPSLEERLSRAVCLADGFLVPRALCGDQIIAP
jgi:hypothetical protein